MLVSFGYVLLRWLEFVATTVTDLIVRCLSRHRSHDGRRQQCRQAVMLVVFAAIGSAVLFTNTIWQRDTVSAPYRACPGDGEKG